MLLLIILGILVLCNVLHKLSDYLPVPKIFVDKIFLIDIVVAGIAFAVQLFIVFGLKL